MSALLSSLLPTPLHPVVVHLPIAFALLVPVFTIGALVAVRRGAAPVRTWSLAVAMSLALTVSAWAAIETGENEEDRVERVVPDAALETHEEAADAFLWLAAAVFGVAAVGMMQGKVGASARMLATVGSLVLLPAGYRVGHSGGGLVYTHNAASAYVGNADMGSRSAPGPRTDSEDREHAR